jgi:hypothetical protein
MLAVVMTAWKRAGYLRQTLESWANVRGLEALALRRVSLDASDGATQGTMTGMAQHYGWDVTVASKHRGVLVNPVESVSAVFREQPSVDFVILAEEDVIVSTDVLEYFTWAQQYRNAPNMLLVCSHPLLRYKPVPDPRPHEVRTFCGFCPLVWGTWRDRWEMFIEPTWDRDYSSGGPNDSGWDWNLMRLMALSRKRALVPGQSRSQHIGEEGGVHCLPAWFADTVDPYFRESVQSCAYEVVEEV